MLTLLAPAKINLTLEVLGKRQDGYHEIRSVIQTIGLCDSLRFQPSPDVTIKSDMPGWIAQESLVSRAVNLVRETTGCSRGVTIEVKKRIPLLSGLGGDSSDAAAVLRGLNRLWELNLPMEKLLQLAQQLGSDVSFFLYGGTALVEGRGEIVTPLPPLPHRWIVLAIPPVPRLPGKTKQLYESLQVYHFTVGRFTRNLVKELRAGKEVTPSLLVNTFENVALTRFSELKVARDHLIKMGAVAVHLAGSGPALFTLVKEKQKAEELYSLLQNQRMETYLAETLAEIEKVE
ncbi:MAG: 4-(cytidine 5'-diphospho)-2-C-methyl-D-erythritol kinase [Dehalococcoidales bacterium]|nr:4-(cytidine 5'-diphospho)-2-C-methyl-D-erythritol kinase [Dehalococcoidales bacterium]